MAYRSSSSRNASISRTRYRSRQRRMMLSTFGSSRNDIVDDRPVVLRRSIRPINRMKVRYIPIILWKKEGACVRYILEKSLENSYHLKKKRNLMVVSSVWLAISVSLFVCYQVFNSSYCCIDYSISRQHNPSTQTSAANIAMISERLNIRISEFQL